ncbi:MAG: VWA domain-containing protein, partial [Chitinivibrionales bacterium]|nr:VWA domain-containing protein [Chitinivibrionales bacterium]
MSTFSSWTIFTAIAVAASSINAQNDSLCEYVWDNCEHAICLDSTTMSGEIIQIPEDVTRISTDGLSLCLEDITTQAATDLVFIVDLSGSMNPYGFNAGGGICELIPGGASQTGDSAIEYNDDSLSLPVYDSPYCYAHRTAGDPHGQRENAIRSGLQQFAASPFAAQSTVGYIGFGHYVATFERVGNDGDEGWEKGLYQFLRPVNFDASGRADMTEQIDMLETIIDNRYQRGGTRYIPPLDTVINWFSDSSLTPNNNKAIIFISDGRSEGGFTEQQNDLDSMDVPLYGIFLGNQGEDDLRTLATDERFYQIPHDQPDSLQAVVDIIIGELMAEFTTGQVTASNNTNGSSAVSDTVIESDTAAGVFDVSLNRIISLDEGINDIEVTANFTSAQGVDTTIGFSFKLDVSGAASECSVFVCYPVSVLEFIEPGPGDSLTNQDAQYRIRLTSYSFNGDSVTLYARTSKGDLEEIVLTNPQTQGNSIVFEGTYPFSSGAGGVGHQNGTSEADFDDTLRIRWEHPDDDRDTAHARMPVRVIPDDIEIHNRAGAIPPAIKYSDYPSTVTCTAGVDFPLVGKLFAGTVWQEKFEHASYDERITWRYKNAETGLPTDTALGTLSDTTGYLNSFYPRQARKEVDIIVFFDEGTSGELSDTVRLRIVPGRPDHLVIEATSDSTVTDLYNDNPLDTIVMDSARLSDTAYAVLRDLESNYISPATDASWGAVDTNVVHADSGNSDEGEGIITKNTGETDETDVFAQSGSMADSVVVITKAYQIISLRIRIISNGQFVDTDSLYMRTSSGDTTLRVEGERSDTHEWEVVSGEWSLDLITGSEPMTDPPAARFSSWQFEPIDTGSGYIKVTFGNAAPDSIPFKFDPGYPTRAEFNIISHSPSDSIKAGDTITAVVEIANNLGPMPGTFCYPGPGGDSVAYQEDLGQGTENHPMPIFIVDSVTGELNTGTTTDNRARQCFTEGTDTVRFVLYYAPEPQNQLTVHLGDISVSTRKFRVYPGDLAKIDIFDKSTDSLVADSVVLGPGEPLLVEIRGYDKYGNYRGCEVSDWDVTDSLHSIGIDSICNIYYEAPRTNLYDKAGNIVATPLANVSLVDSFHVTLIAPKAIVTAAITQDDNANGYL